MANTANYANSAGVILGLLLAALAAILAATRRTPATAGAAVPLLAAATGRQPTRRTPTGRATTRNGTGKANGTGDQKGTGNGKAPRAGNGQTTTATPPRTPRRAKADTTSTAPAVNPVSGTARLQPGKLQEQVLAYLTEHAGEELSPSKVAKALGRSSGAVGNGLESLAKEGEVHKTRQAPRRFMVPARGNATRNGTGKRTAATGQAAAPAAPTPTRATRARSAKAGTGPNATSGTPGNGNGGTGIKAEPPATPATADPAATPTGPKPTTRRGRNKAGAAADQAAATGT